MPGYLGMMVGPWVLAPLHMVSLGPQTPWAACGTSELARGWDSSVACLFEDGGCRLCQDRLGLQGWPVTLRPGARQQGGLALNPAARVC